MLSFVLNFSYSWWMWIQANKVVKVLLKGRKIRPKGCYGLPGAHRMLTITV